MDELTLIQKCLAGDRVYQRILFDRYYQECFHLVRRYVANHHDTEDVLSLVFSKVFGALDRFEFRGEGSLGKWIRTFSINESLRFLSKKKQFRFEEHWEEAEAIEEETNSSFANISIKKVYAILDKMPDGYRTIFNLYAIEGYSHSEIAEILDISPNTSKSQMRKARAYIQKEFAKNKKSSLWLIT